MNLALHIIGAIAFPIHAIGQCFVAWVILTEYGPLAMAAVVLPLILTWLGWAARIDYLQSQPPAYTDSR